jgi:hypothetical protein
MPYIRRNAEGVIVALLGESEADGQEYLPGTHAEVIAFFGSDRSREFTDLDSSFIRVMEDLIDVLIMKGVLRLTDLPPEAQKKLLARKDLRRRLQGALDLLGDGDVI